MHHLYTDAQYVDTVDYGTAVPEPVDTFAKEALVFMIVGMTEHQKHSIGYVLQDKRPTNVQVHLIKDCNKLLHMESLNVLAVVFDGTFINQNTAKMLG